MKKFLFMITLMMGMVSANVHAQIATENAKLFDNTFISVEGGVATPLAFDAVFPLNPTVGLAFGKWFTPVWGAEIEGTAWFGSHVYGGTSARVNFNSNGNFNAIRGTYVGVNGLLNLSNLFGDYQGTPRSFEFGLVSGIGWVHGYRPNTDDRYNNALGAKTGLDLAFNIGAKKAHTISIRPAVLWDLSQPGTSRGTLAFNKLGAQFYLGVAYTYHFKTSNGTHSFKTYDVGAMISEIDRLNSVIDECHRKQPQVIEKVVKEVNTVEVKIGNEFWVVAFNTGSSVLSDEAKYILNQVGNDSIVDVVATASPDGPAEFNQRLSEKRAAVVADYLTKRGIKVNSWAGKGVNPDTGRTAVVKTLQ